MAEPVTLTVPAAEQASILRAAADSVHATMGAVTRHEAPPERWASYVKARRRAALDAVAAVATCRALGVEEVPPWLMVKGAVGHARGLRLDFVDLGLAPYVALVTLEGEAAQFRGVLPLEWVATVETDPGHRFRGASRSGEACALVPPSLLIPAGEVVANLAAMADGSAVFPAQAEGSPVTQAPREEELEQVEEAAPQGEPVTLTPEQERSLPAATLVHPGQPLAWGPDGWEPLADTLEREGGAMEEEAPEAAPGDHVEATAGQMAAGLFRSAGRLITQGVASPEVKAARLAVCDACPHRLKSGRCAKCGCFLAAKAAVAAEVCPIGKW
jgi:hypothetical protein